MANLNNVMTDLQVKEKILKISPRIRTLDPCNNCKYFDIGSPEPDTKNPHKAVHVKIPVEGTNLANQ